MRRLNSLKDNETLLTINLNDRNSPLLYSTSNVIIYKDKNIDEIYEKITEFVETEKWKNRENNDILEEYLKEEGEIIDAVDIPEISIDV